MSLVYSIEPLSPREKIHRYIFYYGLIALVLVLPFNLLWSSWVFILIAINWLFEGGFKRKWQNLKKNYQAFYFIFFFVLHLLTYFYSENLDTFGGHIEKKLALLGYPLILASSTALSGKQVNFLLQTFVLTMLLAMLICLGVATNTYFESYQIDVFFYHELSEVIGLNAIYMATYISFATFVTLYFSITSWKNLKPIFRFGSIFLILFQIIFIFLLSSKTILISFPILINIFLLMYFLVQKSYRFVFLILALNILLISLFSFFEYPRERFKKVLGTDLQVVTKEKVTYEENNQLTGVSIRLLMWRFALESLSEKNAWLIGLGIADAQDALNEKIAAANLYTGNPEFGDTGYIGYNCHNQYVEFLLLLGVVGLVYYLIYLGILLDFAWRYKNYIFLFFASLVIIICFTESFLETNKGVVFFNFFTGLFIFHSSKNSEKTD